MTAKAPAALKLLRGTTRADRAGSSGPLPALADIPDVPDWMQADRHAVGEWRRVCQLLIAYRLLTDGNIGLVEQVCVVRSHMIRASVAGCAPTAALITSYRGLCSELGLLSLPAPSAVKADNPFLRNREKPTEK